MAFGFCVSRSSFHMFLVFRKRHFSVLWICVQYRQRTHSHTEGIATDIASDVQLDSKIATEKHNNHFQRAGPKRPYIHQSLSTDSALFILFLRRALPIESECLQHIVLAWHGVPWFISLASRVEIVRCCRQRGISYIAIVACESTLNFVYLRGSDHVVRVQYFHLSFSVAHSLVRWLKEYVNFISSTNYMKFE